jgi:hypothetical protein
MLGHGAFKSVTLIIFSLRILPYFQSRLGSSEVIRWVYSVVVGRDGGPIATQSPNPPGIEGSCRQIKVWCACSIKCFTRDCFIL